MHQTHKLSSQRTVVIHTYIQRVLTSSRWFVLRIGFVRMHTDAVIAH